MSACPWRSPAQPRALAVFVAGVCLVGLSLAACKNHDETTVLAEDYESNNPSVGDSPELPDSGLSPGSDAGAQSDASDPGSSVTDAGDAGPVMEVDAGADAAPPPVVAMVPPNACARLQGNLVSELGSVIDQLVTQQISECSTALLLGAMPDQLTLILWSDYLYRYTYALLGCPEAVPPPEGFELFALANTAAVGVTAPPLGRDDTEQLIRQYLDQLHVKLMFSAGERASFEAFLRNFADSVVVDDVSGALSTCAPD